MEWIILLGMFIGGICLGSALTATRKGDRDAAFMRFAQHTWPIPTDPPPGDPATAPVFQVSIENKTRAPKWYAPNRDLVNVYSQILHSALKRLEDKKMPSAELARIGKVAQAMGILQRRIVNREFAKNQEGLMKELKAIQESDPYAFSIIGASLLATMTYWFWREYSAVSSN